MRMWGFQHNPSGGSTNEIEPLSIAYWARNYASSVDTLILIS